MPTQRFEARPTLEKDGTVTWELCYTRPDPDLCGNSNADYPNITLGRNTGKHKFEFKITNDQTGLGIKFANDPIWIQHGTKPTGSGIDAQIETPTGKGTSQLTFVNKNSKPKKTSDPPYVLHYQLNFVDKNNKEVTELDPEITNGGTDFVGDNQTQMLLGGIALLILLGAIWFSITAMKRNRARSASARESNRAAAEQRDDVNTTGGGEI